MRKIAVVHSDVCGPTRVRSEGRLVSEALLTLSLARPMPGRTIAGSLRLHENRDKSARWMRGKVLPSLTEKSSRMVVIGNCFIPMVSWLGLQNTGIFRELESPLLRKASDDGNPFTRQLRRRLKELAKWSSRARLAADEPSVGARAALKICRFEACLRRRFVSAMIGAS